MSDINEICRLEREFANECEVISNECVNEGYPSRGGHYLSRVEKARKYYDDKIREINSHYGYQE